MLRAQAPASVLPGGPGADGFEPAELAEGQRGRVIRPRSSRAAILQQRRSARHSMDAARHVTTLVGREQDEDPGQFLGLARAT